MNINEELIMEILKLKEIEIGSININDQTSLTDDLQYNSMEFIQLIVNIENRFNFTFDDEYMNYEIINKYKNLKDYIINKINEQAEVEFVG